jgi:drug/metabolite transporter (DMT)-like permease
MHAATTHDDRNGVAAVLAAAILWSTSGLLVKWVDIDAFGITMWRSLFAAATIAILVRPRGPWPKNRVFWGVAISYAVMLLLFVVATRLTTAANAIFLQYTAPLYVLFLGARYLAERPRPIDVLAVILALGGMALFFIDDFEANSLWGNLAAVGSGLAFAAFLTFLRLPGATGTLRPQAMIAGNLALVAIALPVNLARPGAGSFTPDGGEMAALLFLGIGQIGLAYVIFSYGIARVRALEAALIGMLEPVLNPAWVFIFLGERPGPWAFAGGAVILIAVVARQLAAERIRGRRLRIVATGVAEP